MYEESSRFLLINVVKEKVELEKRLEELEVKLQQAMESSNLIDEEDQKDEEDTSIGEDEYEAERRTVDCSICGLPLIPSRSVQHMKMCWLEAKQEHPSQKYHSNLDISSPAWIMKIESIRAAKDSVVRFLCNFTYSSTQVNM
jgi:chromosome condensin MukBEF ATPase and DNA-binding subunit MukB